MKKAIILLSAFVLLCGQVSALTVFTTDGQINNGETHTNVHVYNSAILDVLGGTANLITGWDTSTVNIYAGTITTCGSTEHSRTNISGNANIELAQAGGFGILNIYAGYISNVETSSEAVANLYGGNILSIKASAESIINLYGYAFNYNPLAGAYDGGRLTGYWLNGTAFSIDLKNYGGGDNPVGITYDNLNLIPEPASMVLLGLGGLLFRRRK